MQIAVTFRHMEASSPIKEYAEEKFSKLKKYIDEPIDAQVVISVEKKIRHNAEVTIVAKGITIKASEESADMYASIDGVADKLERQLKRYKEKIKRHTPSTKKGRQIAKTVFEAESLEEADVQPSIVRSHSFSAKPMSVEEAAMQMDLMHKEFMVFTDDVTEEVNVVYRRKDGNYGLIAPEQ